jgi:RNA polymerase sigma factor (sigma-70 family)
MDQGGYVFTPALIAEISRCTRTVLARKFPGFSQAAREDIEQEVLLKLCRMAQNGKIIDNLSSYLWKAVTTTALDWMEPERGTVSLEGYLEKAGPDRLPEALLVASGQAEIEFRRHLESLLEKLPRERRLVLKLHLAGLGLEETAEHLHWTQPKVRHLFYRALGQLKKMLRASREDEDEAGEALLSVERGVRESLPD